MSKKAFISRYLLIIKRLQSRPYSSYEDLKDYIDNQAMYLKMLDDTLTIAFSLRTLQRDIVEIRNLFGISIMHCSQHEGYYIKEGVGENMNFQRMMESYDIFSSLRLTSHLSPYILLEQTKPKGTESIFDLLHAMKNSLEVQFRYHKFWRNTETERRVAPYALHDFRGRWYLLGLDSKDNTLKTFGLDRLKDLTVLKNKFVKKESFNPEHHVRYCFGVMNSPSTQPQEVLLSFDAFQGNYVKTLPLHSSQKIIKDTENELLVELEIYITHDFIMELLSYGSRVRVLKPESLVKTLKVEYRKALNNYEQ